VSLSISPPSHYILGNQTLVFLDAINLLLAVKHAFRSVYDKLNDAAQDITVGNPAKAQLARAVRNPEEAFNIMRGSFFVVETKFDGRPASAPAGQATLLL